MRTDVLGAVTVLVRHAVEAVLRWWRREEPVYMSDDWKRRAKLAEREWWW